MSALISAAVLFCDNHLLVLNKPAGMPSQGGATGATDVLTSGTEYLRRTFGKEGDVFLGLVHRLDQPVSGVMALARTSKAAARLSEQFREREPSKRYLAIVEGLPEERGVERCYLKKAGRGVEEAREGEVGAQFAELSWVKLAVSADSALLDIRLVTGRKHQIRFQLSRAGHPVVGDTAYGATTLHRPRSIALHCHSLTVDHPTHRRPMTWSVKPDRSWGEWVQEALEDWTIFTR